MSIAASQPMPRLALIIVNYRTPELTLACLEALRQHVARYDVDRFFAPDIEDTISLIQSAAYNRFSLPRLLPSL